MHPIICNFISENFYDRQVLTAPHVRVQRESEVPNDKVISWYDHDGDEQLDGHSYYNETEVKMIGNLFFHDQDLNNALSSKKSVLVITFYNAQRNRLEVKLKEEGVDKDLVTVMSTDGAQGSEADVV